MTKDEISLIEQWIAKAKASTDSAKVSVMMNENTSNIKIYGVPMRQHAQDLPEICGIAMVGSTRKPSTPEMILAMVHARVDRPFSPGMRYETFRKWAWVGFAQLMWFVDLPQVNSGRWLGKSRGCRIIWVYATPARLLLRQTTKTAEHVAFHFGSHSIVTAWDLVVMVLRLRLLRMRQMFVRCLRNLHCPLRMRLSSPPRPQKNPAHEHQPCFDVNCLPPADVRMPCSGWLERWFWGCWLCWCFKN